MTGQAAGDEVQRQNARFYDEEANSYDASRYSSPAGRRVDAFHKQVLARTLFDALPAGAKVLELGCGTGRLASHFAPRCSLTGVDVSAGMLTYARRLSALQSAGLVQGSAFGLPFPGGSFDAAYSILVINLLPDYPSALAEVARVLKPGGRFVFNVPNLQSIYLPAGLYVNLRGRTTGHNRAGFRYSHWFSRGEVGKALERTGMGIAGIKGQPPLLGAGLLRSAFPGTAPASWMCKSLYYVAVKH